MRGHELPRSPSRRYKRRRALLIRIPATVKATLLNSAERTESKCGARPTYGSTPRNDTSPYAGHPINCVVQNGAISDLPRDILSTPRIHANPIANLDEPLSALARKKQRKGRPRLHRDRPNAQRFA